MEDIKTEEVVTEVSKEVVEQAEQVAAETKDVREAFDKTLEKVNADQEALRIDLEAREQELFAKEVVFTLKSNGLEAFADVIHVTDAKQLTDVVNKLTGIVSDIKIESGYIPKSNAKQAEYDIAKQNKDVKGMIGNKLANLFK